MGKKCTGWYRDSSGIFQSTPGIKAGFDPITKKQDWTFAKDFSDIEFFSLGEIKTDLTLLSSENKALKAQVAQLEQQVLDVAMEGSSDTELKRRVSVAEEKLREIADWYRRREPVCRVQATSIAYHWWLEGEPILVALCGLDPDEHRRAIWP